MTQGPVPKPIQLFTKQGKAIVHSDIGPEQAGRVKYQGTSWPARFYHGDCPRSVSPGDPVIVVGRSGLTLLVVPEDYLSPEMLENLGRRRPWYHVFWNWWHRADELTETDEIDEIAA
ncbi:MAG: NfeD family protein [Prochlorothrix sp.]|nr:NfeD family protein [Prochlorothrix sp.]